MALADSVNAIQSASTALQNAMSVLKPVQATLAATIPILQQQLALLSESGYEPTSVPVVQLNVAITALQGV